MQDRTIPEGVDHLLAAGPITAVTMLGAVTADMVDALVLAGTVDDVRRQLRAFDGLFDTLLLLSPSFAADTEEVQENNAAMIAAFAE